MKTVKILRGLPGSGKSTWAKNNFLKPIISADDFHMIDGVYKYDPTKAGEAHADCLRRFTRSLIVGDQDTTIIVDNTNTRTFELAPYVQLAIAWGADCEILYFPCTLEDAIKRNTHGVPDSTILAMQVALNTEVMPPFWKQRVILRERSKEHPRRRHDAFDVYGIGCDCQWGSGNHGFTCPEHGTEGRLFPEDWATG